MRRRQRLTGLLLLSAGAAAPIALPRTLAGQGGPQDEIAAVVISPFIAPRFACAEHYAGELPHIFDALGSDCIVVRDGREYRTDGKTNEDYYIWGEPVLAPFDGVVDAVTINPVVNVPGTTGKSPATLIIFRRADGVRVMYGHLDRITVVRGDSVHAGQPVAVVSNNGMSSGPHVHIGAIDAADHPVQIRWDLRAMAALRTGKRPPGS